MRWWPLLFMLTACDVNKSAPQIIVEPSQVVVRPIVVTPVRLTPSERRDVLKSLARLRKLQEDLQQQFPPAYP